MALRPHVMSWTIASVSSVWGSVSKQSSDLPPGNRSTNTGSTQVVPSLHHFTSSIKSQSKHTKYAQEESFSFHYN